MKRIISACILFAVLSAVACTKGGTLEGVSGNQYKILSSASSQNLVPAIDTTATGTFSGFYDEQVNVFTFSIAWNDLWRTTSKDTITSVNFYGPANAAANGTLVRMLPFVSTNNATSVNLGIAGLNGFTTAEKKDLLEGSYYFTVNTKKYPNGIIRGQLLATKL